MYDCNLVGLFVGLSRTVDNDIPLELNEILAFDTVIVDPVGIDLTDTANSNVAVTLDSPDGVPYTQLTSEISQA